MKQIPQQMARDREGYVENPDEFFDAAHVVEKTLDAIRTNDQDALQGMLVR